MKLGINESYIEAQLLHIAPLPLKDYPPSSMKIKLWCEDRQTNCIDVTPETMRKIESALAEQAVKKDSEEK